MMGWYNGGPGWGGWIVMTLVMLAFWALVIVAISGDLLSRAFDGWIVPLIFVLEVITFFITRMIFLDEEAYPVFVPQNEGMLRP